MFDIIKKEIDKNGYVNTRMLHIGYGLSNYMARKWLASFVEKGILNKTGVQRSPIYVLAK
jgi:ribosomal protein S25